MTPLPPPPTTSKGFYDRISKVYDLIADVSEHEAREAGLAALAARPGERVLEIGFGTGHALVALAEAVGDDGRVVGLEHSGGMLDVTRQRLAESDVAPRVELHLGDARRLPFADGGFDAVFMSFTLELFGPEELPGVLAEIRRVLRPGGRLAVVSLDLRERTSALTEVYVWLHRHFPHFIDCQPIPVAAHVADAGFRIDSRRELSIWSLAVVALTAVK